MNFRDLVEKIYKNKESEVNKKGIEDADRTKFSKKSIKKRLEKIYNNLEDKDNFLSRFPIQIYNEEIKLKLIEYIFNKIECCGQRQIIHNINRKILGKGKKTTIDIDYKKFYSYYKDSDNSNDENAYLSSYERFININRGVIRLNHNIIDKINEVIFYNSQVYKEIRTENNILKAMGIKKTRQNALNEVKAYTKLIYDSWIQALIYIIITNKEILNKNDIIDELLTLQNNMVERLKEVEKENINKYSKMQFNKEDEKLIFDYAIERFDIFVMWMEESSYCTEYVDILKNLEKEMKENQDMFRPIKKEFETTKHMRIADSDKLKNIICEGQKVYQYKQKLEETKKAINIFKKYGGRNIDEKNVRDLKVFFREIYMNDNKYSKRSKKAIGIMRDYYAQLDSKKIEVEVFEKNLDYIFIREKINRGFFRENDLSYVYILKNEIQKNAINLFLELYKLYDETLILEWCNRLNSILFNNLICLLNEKAKFLV
ncbi:hypothetical protein [Clostridium ljungdahlii]|uniref:Uncharacterized protein n=1 Tax=Clostridium ljungdahlii TaxID=1538 RepID=A0A168PJ82_9CLOT|nr:hypothetical protein [Clostridium ljungdahlii]OAA87811.1 hypothetical protein WY13_01926 [Clostridium ljungdahlii]